MQTTLFWLISIEKLNLHFLKREIVGDTQAKYFDFKGLTIVHIEGWD
jgi:hypothetical protein